MRSHQLIPDQLSTRKADAVPMEVGQGLVQSENTATTVCGTGEISLKKNPNQGLVNYI